MFARLKHDKAANALPQEWNESLSRLLNDHYKAECEAKSSYFEIFGQVYPKELLVIASLVDENDQNKLPITCFLSCDEDELSSEKKVKETQKNFIDIFGLIFDEIFQNPDWNEYEIVWQDVHYKDKKYFYKITRENVALSLEASRLLGDSDLD